jgi:hypothetical protein
VSVLLTVKDRGIVEFGSFVVGRQRLCSRLSENSTDAFPDSMRVEIEILSEVQKSFMQPSAQSWKMPGTEENKDYCEDQYQFPSIEHRKHWNRF